MLWCDQNVPLGAASQQQFHLSTPPRTQPTGGQMSGESLWVLPMCCLLGRVLNQWWSRSMFLTFEITIVTQKGSKLFGEQSSLKTKTVFVQLACPPWSCRGFLPHYKDMQVRSFGDSKLRKQVDLVIWLCDWLATVQLSRNPSGMSSYSWYMDIYLPSCSDFTFATLVAIQHLHCWD